MAWDTEVIEIVRFYIGDVDEPQKYTDARIKKAAIISASILIQEIPFTNNYTIDIAAETITPDPTTTDPKDTDFINLLAMKTACLIIQGELKLYATSSMRVVDGPSSIDLASIFTNLQKLNDNMCRMYEKNKNMYIIGQSGYGRVVLSPTTDTSLDPIERF